jgi:tRNA pseudouridine38-40 synthase
MDEHCYRLTLGYRGTDYAGWQRQPNALAVQEVVEGALSRLLGAPAVVVGASRTDAGVHARAQCAHLLLPAPFSEKALVLGTNAHLPSGVRILAAVPMALGFHARKHAAGKLYRYRMIPARVLSPLAAPFALAVSPRLEVAAMAAAARCLEGRHDFAAFALAGGAHGTSVREIYRSELSVERGRDGTEWVYEVEGSGFLRGMVRSIVGTLLEVGGGRRTVEGVASLLGGAARAAAGPSTTRLPGSRSLRAMTAASKPCDTVRANSGRASQG